MKKKNLRLIVSALGIFMVVGLFAGCTKKAENNTNKSTTSSKSGSEIKGSITASGSTALQPLALTASQQFTAKYPDATVNVQAGGSGVGLTQVSEGNVQIGNSDITAEEKLGADDAKALVDHKVCVVGFAAVANEKVKVDNLTKQQLIDIFTGKIKNWKEVGGQNLKIHLITRPDGSGSKAIFEKYGLNGAKEATGVSLTEDSSGTVASAVKETEGSISYLASSFLNSAQNTKGLKVLKYEGLEMNKENITSGKYPIWAYEHMYTKGEATGVAKAFIEFLTSEDVKPQILKLGYYPVDEMKTSR
ncbi:phosphate ABC transporter substrate-binding protein [Clostridium oryzae]|uniref:Phosphate-binding protein n=1 Tax=Clostridium oryzae TaxID=1450648 RepID=A0A1V4IGH8_9CLOT|nr:phosphate ABC transporter substrate-binding protein [Clostridium oryzae]OPJ59101.1 phosphate-binding protein PstS 1 precursor [Clostridium oryzae]